MKISEFVQGRGVEKQAVYRYINRHPELLEKCTKCGKELELSPEVVAELEEKYPLAKPVVIINGLSQEEERELREKLQRTQEMLVAMQNELVNTKLQLAEKEKAEFLLELKEEKIEELTKEVETMKKRSLWERIINK